MTSNRYLYSKYNINMATLRFWGDKPQELLDILHYDTPIGWYVFEGFHAEALSAGFEMVDKEGKPLEAFEAIPKDELKDTVEKYQKARAEANKTHAVIGMFDFEGDGEVFYYLTDGDITTLEIEPGTKNITKLVFNPPHKLASLESAPITVDTEEGLAKLRLLGNYDRSIGKFRCRYESIVDNLLGLSIIDQQLVLLVIRVGSGVRFILAPQSILSDPASRKDLEDFLENMGMNSMLIVPGSSVADDKFKFELNFGEGTPPIDWTVSRSNLLKGISARIGVTIEIFDGNPIGLRSSEKADTRFLRSINREQLLMDEDLMWSVSIANKIEVADTDKMSWFPYVEMDEETQITIFKLSMEAFKAGLEIHEQAGMPVEWIKDQLGLDYKIDQSLITKHEQMKETMQEALNEGVTEGTTDETGSSAEDSQSQDRPDEDTED